MDSSRITVPAKFVNTMLNIAAERNCDTDALLEDIGINPKDIEQEQPVSAILYGELHHHIIELVQDEAVVASKDPEAGYRHRCDDGAAAAAHGAVAVPWVDEPIG